MGRIIQGPQDAMDNPQAPLPVIQTVIKEVEKVVYVDRPVEVVVEKVVDRVVEVEKIVEVPGPATHSVEYVRVPVEVVKEVVVEKPVEVTVIKEVQKNVVNIEKILEVKNELADVLRSRNRWRIASIGLLILLILSGVVHG